jgi:hypothetical protein
MKSAANSVRNAALALAAFGLSSLFAAASASAQAPYLLPYTIQSLAGGGTAPKVGATCTDPVTGVTGTAYDTAGDGCPIGSGSVVVGVASDIHDVVVDGEGNVYFIDNSTDGAVRRIDAHSGIVSIYAGTVASTQPAVCAGTFPAGPYDKYGDNCPANDGKANAGGGYTAQLGKLRGLGIGKNGDVFLADYSNGVVHKISLSTGLMTVVAGSFASSTKLTSNGGVKGFSGDGSYPYNPNATPTPQGAALQAARGVTRDLLGNIYIADSGNNVIRKITYSAANPLGIISTVVGSDANAPSAATAAPSNSTTSPAAIPYMANGDGSPAGSSTLLDVPEDIEVDAQGNLFIADMSISRVRVVYAGGTTVANLIMKTNPGVTPVVGDIYTVMGSGVATNGSTTATTTSAGPVLATSVVIASPRKLRLDTNGNLFVADNGNNVIWFLDAATGYMRVIAGELGMTTGSTANGTPVYCAQKTDAFGDNCPATQATFNPNAAMGVFVDAKENLYITDPSNQRLRKVSTNQVFPVTAAGSTVSQTLEVHFAAKDAPAAANPYVITGSPDFTLSGTPTCNAGTNADGTQECLVTVSFKPTVAGTDTAVLTVASTANGSAQFSLTGIGTAASIAFDPGAASVLTSSLGNPQGIAQDAAGNTYIADTGNNRVLEISANGTSTVIAGTGAGSYTGDGAAATAATLNAPKAVAVTASGLIYIADTGNNVIRQVNPATGFISTVAGGGTGSCGSAQNTANDSFGDGCPGANATFTAPSGLAADIDGNVYIADSGNGLIRELTLNGYVFLYGGGAASVAGTCADTFGDGCLATSAIFKSPSGLAVDANRDVFVADTGNNLVREISASTHNVIAIAGNGVNGSSGNGGPATGAQLSAPTGVAVDAAGNVYIADTGNQVVRVVNGSGTIATVAGTLGSSGTGTVPGLATGLLLSSPAAVASNGAGSLVILDSANNRAVADARNSIAFNFGVTNPGSSSPTFQIQQTNTGSAGVTLGTSNGLFTPAPSSTTFSLQGATTSGCASSSAVFAPGASCLLVAGFNPPATTLGPQAGTFVEATSTAVTNAAVTPAPSITLSGISEIVTATTAATVITNPATGSPQYPVPFTVTTTVTPVSCNLAAPVCSPSGSVTFFVGGVQVGLPVAVTASANGTSSASQTIPGQSVGNYSVTAVYSGDTYYAASSAPALAVAVTVGATTSTVSANPSNGVQFAPITLTANVAPTSTVKTTSLPTGTVTFKVTSGGVTTTLGTASLSPTTGTASLADIFVAATNTTPAHNPNSFGLTAGTYALTASYSGDANYAASTSASSTLVIGADPQSFTVNLLPTTAGTAQGSTATVTATITPTNTLNGTLHFTCTNLPANVTCTFGPPPTLTFTPVALLPTAQTIDITLFTDVPAGVTQTTSFIGWPLLLVSFGGILAFRRRLRANPLAMQLMTVFALCGILAGGACVMTGCSGTSTSNSITPTGTYTINFVTTGPNNLSVTTPFNFVVGQGAPGQL